MIRKKDNAEIVLRSLMLGQQVKLPSIGVVKLVRKGDQFDIGDDSYEYTTTGLAMSMILNDKDVLWSGIDLSLGQFIELCSEISTDEICRNCSQYNIALPILM